MKFSKYTYLILATFFALTACNNSKEILEIDRTEFLDTVAVYPEPDLPIYQASNERINDLLHTKLEVSFNWDSSFLYGKAELTFKPYFYPTDSLTLDAKGFQIHELSLLNTIGEKLALNYSYDTSKIYIDLDQEYSRKDTFRVYVKYTAMPNKFESGGSQAITSEKGLYFINPKGLDKNKPKQIWTQGETESSSRWFPTIDSPNEKTTQEIYITVDSVYETLSNGKLLFQTINEDGTRTDYWKQELPHAPYLFMMAIGDYAIVEDEWREIPVNYYVEHEFKPYAKEIFPNTPEMLEFFSTKLGYSYPWDKYHQVVVRDYVSGAMENTGAVIYGEFVQGEPRYLIDNSGEDVVAHELFHHWFGDLVTTESWSNLPLNESFATYGEYLWNEYKYGKDQADYGGQTDLKVHLQSSKLDKKRLIRFDYEDEMEMFDTHSYQKGGRVLHMLRKEVGDEAFFEAIKNYLHKNAYKAAEIHNLRLAFEETTGKDLNWFFNQWFLQAGNPELVVDKTYDDSLNLLKIKVVQEQKGNDIPAVFILNTDLKIVSKDGIIRKQISLNKRENEFIIPLESTPLAVLFDTDKDILGTIEYEIDENEAIYTFENAEHYLDKENALSILKDSKNENAIASISKAIDDEFWAIRKSAIRASKYLAESQKEKTLERLLLIAEKDKKSDVRREAISALEKYYLEELEVEKLKEFLTDSSYIVVSQALETLFALSKEDAINEAKELEDYKDGNIIQTIGLIYAEDGNKKYAGFFRDQLENLDEFDKYAFLISYTTFLEKQSSNDLIEPIKAISEVGMESKYWFIRMSAVNSLVQLKDYLEDKNSAENNTIVNYDSEVIKEINSQLYKIKQKETNSNLLKLINKELE